jgi:tRNA splicing endonuclease
MMFMVVETFRNQDAKAIYRRLREKGRMMPDGLKFVSSWVAADLGRCFSS